jgi:hypothetical protein
MRLDDPAVFCHHRGERRNRGSAFDRAALRADPMLFVLRRLGITPQWHSACKSKGSCGSH